LVTQSSEIAFTAIMGNSDTDGTVVIEIRSFESRNPKKKVDNV